MSDFVIETKKLTKIYGEQTAVNSVNLHVKPGRIYGLLGRNGAGKTTIMKMILGLTPITSGEVDVFGQNIKGHEKRIYPRIGAIIETPGFYPNLTGTENLEIFAKLRGTPRPNAVKNALEVVGLPYRDKKLFSKYSLGMKQRLGIANAILHDPELLILDEPTSGLDPVVRAEMLDIFLEFISDGKRSILVSSHITSDLERIADYITFIHQGRLLMSKNKDELLYGYAIAKADRQTLHAVDSRLVEVMQDTPYGSQALVNDREQFTRRYPDILLDSLTLDEMMLMLCRNKQ